MAQQISENHWRVESFRERVPASVWRQALLERKDEILFRGELRKLVAKDLGYGVIEISKAPLDSLMAKGGS